jgi:hypothetical protein
LSHSATSLNNDAASNRFQFSTSAPPALNRTAEAAGVIIPKGHKHRRCGAWFSSAAKNEKHEERKADLDVNLVFQSDAISAEDQIHAEQQKICGRGDCRRRFCYCGCYAGCGVLRLGAFWNL